MLFSHSARCLSLYLWVSLLICIIVISIYQYTLAPRFCRQTYLTDLSKVDDMKTSPSSIKDTLSPAVKDSHHIQRTPPAHCSDRPFTNIVFLKVHKSGSTTVANLLARYALTHDLNIALPDKPPGIPRSNYFPRTSLDKHIMPLADGQQYNILFNHMIYDRTALDRIMPRDTFYCSIMREPLSRFISAVNYYRWVIPIEVKHYLFIDYGQDLQTEEPDVVDTDQRKNSLAEVITGHIKVKIERLSEIYNSIASNSGLPVQDQNSKVAIMEHVDKLDAELDLMMVMERFDESLVLLKRRACLRMKDIVYLQLNTAKNRRLLNLTDTDRDFVQSWQMADEMLYNHFYKKFNIEVDKEGESFQDEVKHFREILLAMENFCDSRASMENDIFVVKSSPWNTQFTMNAQDCTLMTLKELIFQKKLILRARMRNPGNMKG